MWQPPLEEKEMFFLCVSFLLTRKPFNEIPQQNSSHMSLARNAKRAPTAGRAGPRQGFLSAGFHPQHVRGGLGAGGGGGMPAGRSSEVSSWANKAWSHSLRAGPPLGPVQGKLPAAENAGRPSGFPALLCSRTPTPGGAPLPGLLAGLLRGATLRRCQGLACFFWNQCLPHGTPIKDFARN